MVATSKEKIDIKGEISIHTENILPIIKKWLYSEHEIFLRELISNGFDAITKLDKIATKEGLSDYQREGRINIVPDEKAKTITISDNGLGLDAEEVQKYINQIAFSGAQDFIEKFKDKDEKDQIIGQFGLGFYSAFMVSDTVEIKSLSYKKGSTPIHWSCDGSTEFTLKETEKDAVGTDIILHINEENKNFLTEAAIEGLVKKFSNYLPVEIQVNGKKANNQNPLWLKQPTEVKDEEYKEFYKAMFPGQQEPLFWIHINVDYPFNLKGILYFPKLMHELDSNKSMVQLFCQQVFVTDNARDVLPEFLTLLQGALDCPDIPLNVSRSYLQNEPYIQKISKHIVKKIADKLVSLHKKDQATYESYWEDIHPFIKYGMMQNQDFYEKVKDAVLFQSSLGYSTTLEAYTERNKEKLDKTVLYCADKEVQASYVALCKENDLEVLFIHSLIDSHFLQFLETKDLGVTFKSVDSDVSEHLVSEDKESKVVDPKDNKTSDDKLVDLFTTTLGQESLKVEVKALKSTEVSAMIIESEHIKRLKTLSSTMKGMSGMPVFDDYTLIVNSNNDLVKSILSLEQTLPSQEKTKTLCQQVYDLAMMAHKPLTGEQMQAFIKRTTSLLKDATN